MKMFDFLDDFDIFDWMFMGPLSEDLADKEDERRHQEEDLDQDDDP